MYILYKPAHNYIRFVFQLACQRKGKKCMINLSDLSYRLIWAEKVYYTDINVYRLIWAEKRNT